MNDRTQPIHTVRYGTIQATVWARNTLHGVFFDITVRRRYKTHGGQRRDTRRFNDTDLPALAKAVTDVHTWIHQRKAEAAARKVPDPTASER